MTTQRQYTLANCKLVLEGWEDVADPSAPPSSRPMLSMVTNMECHFSGIEKPLTGGPELLTNLVHTVSRYAQEVLSGVEHPVPPATQTVARVQMQSLGRDRHRLTVNQAATNNDPSKYQVELSTTQLFDLVEVVDQLVADGQTLPQLAVDLSPVPKRFVATQEPVTEKLLPATLGVSSLAVAAIALFLIPVPEVKRPNVDPTPAVENQDVGNQPSNSGASGPDPDTDITPDPATDETSSEPTDTATTPPDDQSAGEASETAPTSGVTSVEDDESSAAEVEESNNPPSDSTDGNPVDDDSAAVTGPDAGDGPEAKSTNLPDSEEIDRVLASAQPIADPDKLSELTRMLRDRVDRAWDRPETITKDFVYRVGIAEDGELIGFSAVNGDGFDTPADNPLNKLEMAPRSVESSGDRPVGQFRVVFRTTGVIEVSPWYGRLPE